MATQAGAWWPRATLAKGLMVPEALRIVHLPEEIKQYLLPGHWEGDSIKGSFSRSAVGTMIERKTRFVVLCRMDGCAAADALCSTQDSNVSRRSDVNRYSIPGFNK